MEEMEHVLRALCRPFPPLSPRPTQPTSRIAPPFSPTAPYKHWFTYDTVRAPVRDDLKGQQELLDVWWKALDTGEHLLAHVPTGLGKTSAATYATLAKGYTT
jgi:hypothetical protein